MLDSATAIDIAQVTDRAVKNVFDSSFLRLNNNNKGVKTLLQRFDFLHLL